MDRRPSAGCPSRRTVSAAWVFVCLAIALAAWRAPDAAARDDGRLQLAQQPPAADEPQELVPPQPPTAAQAAPTGGATAVELPRVPRRSVSLAVGRGQIVRFGRPVDRILLADPMVGDLEVLSPQLVYLFGSSIGRTDVFALSGDDEVVAILDVDVTPDLGGTESDLRQVHGDTGVDLNLIEDRVVATGPVADVAEAVDVAAALRSLSPDADASINRTVLRGSQQVNLRVRFAEVSRSDIFRLGINWQTLLDIDDFAFGVATGQFVGLGGIPLVAGETFGTAFGAVDTDDVEVDLLIDALRREGLITVLAEPNLTVRNGETASFLAGGEFPIPVPNVDGTITIEFREFGVSLTFTATLLPGDLIGVRVRPEVSALSFEGGIELQGLRIPALTVRRTETSVELASGQTFAIAGLFQRNLTNDLDSVPLLGDLPILGPLFRSVRFQQDESELVILITPYLVQPKSERDFALPSDPANGLVGAAAPAPAPAPAARLAGFIIN